MKKRAKNSDQTTLKTSKVQGEDNTYIIRDGCIVNAFLADGT